MNLLEELERLIAEARARLAEMPMYVPMSDEEWEYVFGG